MTALTSRPAPRAAALVADRPKEPSGAACRGISPLSRLVGGAAFEPCPPPAVTQPAEAADDERVAVDGLGRLEEGVQHLVVAGRGQLEAFADGQPVGARR